MQVHFLDKTQTNSYSYSYVLVLVYQHVVLEDK